MTLPKPETVTAVIVETPTQVAHPTASVTTNMAAVPTTGRQEPAAPSDVHAVPGTPYAGLYTSCSHLSCFHRTAYAYFHLQLWLNTELLGNYQGCQSLPSC